MARHTETVADVDVDEVDEVEAVDGAQAETAEKTPKAKKEPARGDLPEGYVTPIGLAKELTTRKLHTNREGEVVEVRPQMVYSYIKNAPKDHPFPLTTVTDSIGKERQALLLEEGVQWWIEKNERQVARKANAAQKAAKKAEKAAAKPAEGEGNGNAEVVEAE